MTKARKAPIISWTIMSRIRKKWGVTRPRSSIASTVSYRTTMAGWCKSMRALLRRDITSLPTMYLSSEILKSSRSNVSSAIELGLSLQVTMKSRGCQTQLWQGSLSNSSKTPFESRTIWISWESPLSLSRLADVFTVSTTTWTCMLTAWQPMWSRLGRSSATSVMNTTSCTWGSRVLT